MDQNRSSGMLYKEEQVNLFRKKHPAADLWAQGYGVIRHNLETQARIFNMADAIAASRGSGSVTAFFELLSAADRIASTAMRLVVHQTYARNVYLDGRELTGEDFKKQPEGHTGGALNMVPAYTGYMAVNAITGFTRAWMMGQGHCVAAIDSVNLLLDNMTPAHAERYSVSDAGLSRYVQDFYSYRLKNDGTPDSPLGSHVNIHTAGGISEGGYLGFAELQYVHQPLPGERLVVFLSDGAFEEQRGSDWVPRWWRANDCGLVVPIMIKNGRRIDQRTTISQQGAGSEQWFVDHLKLNGFDPLVFDGRDPAAFVWAIFEMETRLEALSRVVATGHQAYPVPFPYGIAVAPKGAGFFGEGTNLAHNLPLGANPYSDAEAARHFNEGAKKLWVPVPELKTSIARMLNDGKSRPQERDHSLACRDVRLERIPQLITRDVPKNRLDRSTWTRSSPMQAVDFMFIAAVQANPHLRPRVGNPDEMRSNRLIKTLEGLKFRVTDPEPGIPEDTHGAVITALNEEAVASAALANKGGINLVHTYEAFGTKMFGAMRQEIIFADHSNEAGCPPGWLAVPLVLTSHTWENSKNERSHQDPSMAEAMLAEPSDVSRVLFVPDHNSASVVMQDLYQHRGQIWTLVVPKMETIPDLFTPDEAAHLLADGAIRLDWAGYNPARQAVILTAIGAYQLEQVLIASGRLSEKQVAHSVVYMLEPGRFRRPRSNREGNHCVSTAIVNNLFPDSVKARVFISHTHPEPLLGTLQLLNNGHRHTMGLGFINHGGTLNVRGLLYVNQCTWAHVIEAVSMVSEIKREYLLTAKEMAVLDGQANPEGVII